MQTDDVGEALCRAVAGRAAEDRRDARWLIVLGVPFALLGWLGLTGILWLLASTFLPWNPGTVFWISAAIALAAILLDCIFHPVEEWKAARYYLTDGTSSKGTSGTSITGYGLFDAGQGAFGGMPLMTNMSDPANWAERGRVIANGCSNIVLSGPRNIRQGLAKYALARHRNRPTLLASAQAFLSWLRGQGTVPRADVEEALQQHPEWRAGARLACELCMARTLRENGKHLVEYAGEGE